MSVAAITITYNRLDLTKRMVESFYEKTSVDYHLFIDNGSTDGTPQWVKENHDHILLDQNYGITEAFCLGVSKLDGYDYILKLDNDVEIVTEKLIEKMVAFLDRNPYYAVSPVDLDLLPNFRPAVHKRTVIDGYKVEVTSHTGGAVQLARADIVRGLCADKRHFQRGDFMIGHWYRRHNINPAYLTDLEMHHIGLHRSTPAKEYRL